MSRMSDPKQHADQALSGGGRVWGHQVGLRENSYPQTKSLLQRTLGSKLWVLFEQDYIQVYIRVCLQRVKSDGCK